MCKLVHEISIVPKWNSKKLIVFRLRQWKLAGFWKRQVPKKSIELFGGIRKISKFNFYAFVANFVLYSGVKKECDLVAQNAKNSLIWLVHNASLLKYTMVPESYVHLLNF